MLNCSGKFWKYFCPPFFTKLEHCALAKTIRVFWHVTNSLTYFSGQLWKLNRATLINKAGLWKSKGTWNLVPLEKEIFNSNDTKGELDTFLSDKIHCSQLGEVGCQISVL
jgi:hypothetical protein